MVHILLLAIEADSIHILCSRVLKENVYARNDRIERSFMHLVSSPSLAHSRYTVGGGEGGYPLNLEFNTLAPSRVPRPPIARLRINGWILTCKHWMKLLQAIEF